MTIQASPTKVIKFLTHTHTHICIVYDASAVYANKKFKLIIALNS